jgi:hypothetical protein
MQRMKAKPVKSKVTKPAANSGKTAGRKMPVGRPFKPGESGNPSGRPSCVVLSAAVRASLAELVPNDPDARTYAKKIVDKVRELAVDGNMGAIEFLADRSEGKARQFLQSDSTVTSVSAVTPYSGMTPEQLKARRLALIEQIDLNDDDLLLPKTVTQ